LGEGAYGKVYFAEKDNIFYALKEVSKSFILNVNLKVLIFFLALKNR
jgi:hypothetical protein